MTLTTLGLGFAPVAALFVAAGWLTSRRRLSLAAALVLITEAFVVSLFAALWFGSLGSGGWWLVFGLVGALVAGAERGVRWASTRASARSELAGFALGLARYLAAGALLAWRLG